MTIKYFLRGKGSSVPVYVRVSISREKLYRKKTVFNANSDTWDKDRSLQLKLRKLQNEIEESYNETMFHNEQWIDSILYNEKKGDTVQNQVDSIIKNAAHRKNHKGGIGLSEGRVKIFQTFRNIIDNFRPNIPLASCDAKLAGEFTEWLFEKGYSVNYVGKNIELLKTTCRDAEKQGKKINPEIKLVEKLKEPKKELIIITEAEQDKIRDLDNLSPYLDNARKWILLGCQVGQRGGDLLSLSERSIVTVKGNKLFELVQQKTGKQIYIPLIPKTKKIIKDGFPKQISLQKLNKYMKEVCELAGMKKKVQGLKRSKNGQGSKTGLYPKWEIIGTHDLRRSFATNYYGKIPTPVLMGITGHSSETVFLKYIGKSNIDNALEFLSHF